MATIIAIAAAAGTVFVYLDMRHRRKKTDSRLWFWVKDLYSKHGLEPPPPPGPVEKRKQTTPPVNRWN